MDLEKFYFTYGSDDVQPYCGGWTEVWAPNYQMACQALTVSSLATVCRTSSPAAMTKF